MLNDHRKAGISEQSVNLFFHCSELGKCGVEYLHFSNETEREHNVEWQVAKGNFERREKYLTSHKWRP